MAIKLKAFLLHTLLPICFWLGVWEVLAIIVGHSYFLPHVSETALALVNLFKSENFLEVTLLTLARILLGITFGTLIGGTLAIISHKFKLLHALISPINSIVRATPVASIIILLWISMNGNSLAVFVSFLMVFPIIFQNLYDAFSSIDYELIEVARVFRFSYKKKLKLLILPALKKYFIPAFITAIGLAFKAEIAAEIIAGVSDSIGGMIYDAKDALNTADVFAWTIVGIALSILIEKITKSLLIRKKATKKEAEI